MDKKLHLAPNLARLLRPFAMPRIDTSIVIFVSLVANGFKSALATFVTNQIKVLYVLCQDRLSAQAHYDFGIRNISQVLRGLGRLSFEDQENADLSEVASVLKQVNLPRLLQEDIPMFLFFLNDLFPGVSLLPSTGPDLEKIVIEQAKFDGLSHSSVWIDCILDLYEVCNARQIVMVCGPSCSGKTSMLTTLTRALSTAGQKQNTQKIFPKAVTVSNLLGWFDPNTNHWHDGIFSMLWRSRAKKQDNTCSWITLDGPLDPVWMENFGCVLDEKVVFFLRCHIDADFLVLKILQFAETVAAER